LIIIASNRFFGKEFETQFSPFQNDDSKGDENEESEENEKEENNFDDVSYTDSVLDRICEFSVKELKVLIEKAGGNLQQFNYIEKSDLQSYLKRLVNEKKEQIESTKHSH
jgi:hypothetical protein